MFVFFWLNLTKFASFSNALFVGRFCCIMAHFTSDIIVALWHTFVRTYSFKFDIIFTQVGPNRFWLMHTQKKKLYRNSFFGGDRGIRTLAALANPNSLANCPLRPAWVCLHFFKALRFYQTKCFIWRRGWDSNPRYAHTYANFQDWCLKPTRPPLLVSCRQ